MPPLLRSVSRLTLTARRTKNVFLPAVATNNLFNASDCQRPRAISPLTHRTITSSALAPVAENDSSVPAERHLPEHAVISTFDLFSIGGPSTRIAAAPLFLSTPSWPVLFPHRWSYACCKDFHRRSTRARPARKSMNSSTLFPTYAILTRVPGQNRQNKSVRTMIKCNAV